MGAQATCGHCHCNSVLDCEPEETKQKAVSSMLADSLDENVEFDKYHIASSHASSAPRLESGPPSAETCEDGFKENGEGVLIAGEQEPVRFEVSLCKNGQGSFGFAHVPMEDDTSTLLVVDMRPDSPIARWNAAQAERGQSEYTVQEGDRICSVSGVASDLDCMRAQLRGERVTFTVERWPRFFVVVLQKRDVSDRFGMQTEVRMQDGRQELIVTAVADGLVEEWNRWAYLSKRFYDAVLPGMAVAAVCEVKDNAFLMQDTLGERTKVEVTFVRPEPEELLEFRRVHAKPARG